MHRIFTDFSRKPGMEWINLDPAVVEFVKLLISLRVNRFFFSHVNGKCQFKLSGDFVKNDVIVNNSKCPRCGFSYMFDGNTCGHCNYPDKPQSVDNVDFIIDYTVIAIIFVFIAFVITLIYFLVRKDFALAGLSFLAFIAVVVVFGYGGYITFKFLNDRTPGRKLLRAIEGALDGKDASIDRVRKLIDAGADVNYAKIVGVTPLSRAVEERQSEIVKLLLEAGANVNLRVQNRSTPTLMRLKESPLFIASRGGYGLPYSFRGDDIRQLPNIARLYAADNELKKRSRSSRAEIVKLLLEAGADVDNGQQGGATPLWIASQEGNERIVNLLLAAGARVDARSMDGATPLIAASEKGHHGVVQLLLQAGADVNARMMTNDTALDVASKKGHKHIVKLLRNAGNKKRKEKTSYPGRSGLIRKQGR